MRHRTYILAFFLFIDTCPCQSQVDSNRVFEKAKGTLPHPVNALPIDLRSREPAGSIICYYGPSVTYELKSAECVKAIFEGEVVRVFEIDSIHSILTKFGDYYICYGGLAKTYLKKGDYIYTNEILGDLREHRDSIFSLDLSIMKANKMLDPGKWLKSKRIPNIGFVKY